MIHAQPSPAQGGVTPCLSAQGHARLAELLHRVALERRPIECLTTRYPEVNIADGYAIQASLTELSAVC
jgi:2-keto-4-pentenoate hydratase